MYKIIIKFTFKCIYGSESIYGEYHNFLINPIDYSQQSDIFKMAIVFSLLIHVLVGVTKPIYHNTLKLYGSSVSSVGDFYVFVFFLNLVSQQDLQG